MSVRLQPGDWGGQNCDCTIPDVWGILEWRPKSWPNYDDTPHHDMRVFTSEAAAMAAVEKHRIGGSFNGWTYRVVKLPVRCGHEPTLTNVRRIADPSEIAIIEARLLQSRDGR